MYRENRREHIDFKKIILLLICIICPILFLSVGYAALESITLNLDGTISAEPINELIIANVKYNSGASTHPDVINSIVREYYQTMMKSTISLTRNNDSAVTYDISIYNGDSSIYVFEKVEYLAEGEFYDNDDIVFELDGLTKGDIIEPSETINFRITFHYLDNIVSENNVLNSLLKFKFNEVISLSDVGILMNTGDYTIYNLLKDTVLMQLTNQNDYDIDIKLKIGNNVLFETIVPAKGNITSNLEFIDCASNLQSNTQYNIMLELLQPEFKVFQTNICVMISPTITNYTLGIQDAGSEENPYIVYKVEDFLRFSGLVTGGTKFIGEHVNQIANIDFNHDSSYYDATDTSFGDINGITSDGNIIKNELTTGTGFPSIGTKLGNANTDVRAFYGIFDGLGHKIENLYIDETSTDPYARAGLFGYLWNATLKNLSIYGECNILSDGAAFVGGIYGNSSVINCHNYANVTNSTVTGVSIGGLIGACMEGSVVQIEGCSNNANIVNLSASAGLVGFVWSSEVNITKCYNIGVICSSQDNASNAVAGIVVKDSSTGGNIVIKESYNAGLIKGGGTNRSVIGGIIAISRGTLEIENCYNLADLVDARYAGGILGEQNSSSAVTLEVKNTYNAGSLINIGSRKGGLIGQCTAGTYSFIASYYKDDTSELRGCGSSSSTTIWRKKSEYMKGEEFLTLLGNKFSFDVDNINKEYPILLSNSHGIGITTTDELGDVATLNLDIEENEDNNQNTEDLENNKVLESETIDDEENKSTDPKKGDVEKDDIIQQEDINSENDKILETDLVNDEDDKELEQQLQENEFEDEENSFKEGNIVNEKLNSKIDVE